MAVTVTTLQAQTNLSTHIPPSISLYRVQECCSCSTCRLSNVSLACLCKLFSGTRRGGAVQLHRLSKCIFGQHFWPSFFLSCLGFGFYFSFKPQVAEQKFKLVYFSHSSLVCCFCFASFLSLFYITIKLRNSVKNILETWHALCGVARWIDNVF